MKRTQSRRQFLVGGAKCGGTCCALLALSRILPAQEGEQEKQGPERNPVDLKALAYCGIPFAFCERQCELYKATRDNDAALKRSVYDRWQMKAKFGLEFDPSKVFCYGCKPGEKPLKVGMAECPVRTCPMANGLESCVQCSGLAACDKAFWKEWPNAHTVAKTLQARYKDQPGAVLKSVRK